MMTTLKRLLKETDNEIDLCSWLYQKPETTFFTKENRRFLLIGQSTTLIQEYIADSEMSVYERRRGPVRVPGLTVASSG
jgi:hypothetical protein